MGGGSVGASDEGVRFGVCVWQWVVDVWEWMVCGSAGVGGSYWPEWG